MLENKMNNLVDWISFTIHVGHHDDVDWLGRVIDQKLAKRLGNIWVAIWDKPESWELQGGRAPYGASYFSKKGFRVYFGKPEHVAIEVQGQGCEFLREIGAMTELLSSVHQDVTRIDIACDMMTKTMPTEFVEKMSSKKFRSRSLVQSDTGETVYVGSKKSDRYARVYRYFKPHPRADMLRCEMVFKGKEGKMVAKKASSNSVDDIAQSGGKVFGWSHEDWESGGAEIDMKAYKPERRSGKTLRWLISQVAPAFRKLVSEGVIEHPVDFIQEYFLEGDQEAWHK